MTTNFDLILLLTISVAALASSSPKREAIAFCLMCTFGIVYADDQLTGIIQAYIAIVIEAFAVFALVFFGQKQRIRQDKWFFFAMAGFMMVSVATTVGYSISFNGNYILNKQEYLFFSHAVAVSHAAFMLVYSDGIKRFIRDWLDNMLYGRFGLFDTRD